MKKLVSILIGLTLLLSGCGTLEIAFDVTPSAAIAVPAVPELATPASFDQTQVKPASVALTLDSTSAEIQSAMLVSATKWDTIWLDGTVTWYDPTGSGQPPQVYHEQVWIDQSLNRFRVLQGAGEGADTFKVSDGLTILEMNLTNGQSQSRPMPDFAKEAHYVPPLEPGMSYPNPLWGQIGTPLSELVFSADRAQGQGTFKPVSLESVAGREALAVEWTYTDNKLPSFRAWLDMETAVILKMQEFGKGGGEDVQSEHVVNQVAYDLPLDDSLFGLQFSELPAFSDVSGKPLVAAQPAPALSSESDPLGQVYFSVTDHNYANEIFKLVRLPGSCVTGAAACPEPETVNLPFNLNFGLAYLVWSPDGSYAALAYPVNQEARTTELYLFDPEKQSWQSLAEFVIIDAPYWSPDGQWLAFRVQDGNGGDEIYAVRRDGSDLTNMTASDKLPPEGRPYILSGWINDNLLLISGNPGGNGLVYLRRVGDGFTKPLFDQPWTKSLLVPSPDGSFLAYSDTTEQKTVLKLLTPDGNTFRDLATFQNSSIYPILWSPDGAQLAFTVMTSESINGQDVYLIERDGRNLQQVYHSATGSISTVDFSPDGLFLIVQDDDATGRHIYTVDLSTLEVRLLQAPNLPLDWWWLLPSWRP